MEGNNEYLDICIYLKTFEENMDLLVATLLNLNEGSWTGGKFYNIL
ncbi:hypothetical protein DDB_G0268392 [Dictyostelium discoideum AX4]|nr:hypothetical protein DDB_G0268392 [Dictyostelium discoideum AX4]EAL73649.1 hypothetical protein DDB_G0268392 [Dictyostelium discoideum AX4]|eukprot:XP_647421.1 hypothetical protein DDB_G0268392 [Dictyostelium discoideum AX4]